ncbi:MAG: cysteine desulfurase [Deltaproteobacteria bacterium]|nr:MAG: cysteine desulfurase [Deltaproteobacteria bacterium]
MALIYLDHHATTPCDPRVVEVMLPYFSQEYGNASSTAHRLGLSASVAVERARGQLAALIGASPDEILWTSGATESNNLALLGTAMGREGGHFITTAIEHRAVLDPLAHLEPYGFEVSRVGVGASGVVDPADIARALRPDSVMISVMAANNEIGTLQPLPEIAEIARRAGVLLHVDAAQAVGRIPVDVRSIGVDLLSLTAHKFYGPKGVGALYVRSGRPRISLTPLLHGGGQERALRPGTLPVPLIVGLGHAAVLAQAELGRPSALRPLRDTLLAALLELPGVAVNGCLDRRLPHNLSVRVDGLKAATLLMAVRDELALSAGSACSSGTGRPSHVLTALGLSPSQALSTLRIGLGRGTTPEQVQRAAQILTEQLQRLRG